MTGIARCTTPHCTDDTAIVAVSRSVDVSTQWVVSYGKVVPTSIRLRLEHASGLVHDDGSYQVETFQEKARG